MNLDKLDRIILKGDDAHHIMDWDRNNHYNYNREEFNFPLTEGILEVTEYLEIAEQEMTSMTYFKITEEYMLFKQYDKSDGKEILSFKIVGTEDGGEFSDMKTSLKRATQKELDDSARLTVYLCFCVFQYMTLSEKHVIETNETKTIKKKQKGKKVSKNNKSRTVKINTTRYTFDFSEPLRTYDRHTLAWNVRGHWRQLKSGKRVWIKPYPKGNPDKIEPKEYKL